MHYPKPDKTKTLAKSVIYSYKCDLTRTDLVHVSTKTAFAVECNYLKLLYLTRLLWRVRFCIKLAN